MLDSFNFGLSKYLFLIIFLTFSQNNVFAAPLSVNLNQKLCSFKAGDYSLQWAYEPQSKNVVFVLKQKSELNNFWTGVGFGDRKKGIIDFIGVFVKNGQIGIADTHIIPDDGKLTPDPSTNVQSIAFDYHNKSVTAKFARALKSPDEKFDQNLDNCQIFNFAINGGSISRSGIVPDFDEIAEKRICDIDKNCIVDIRQHLKPTSESESTKTKDSIDTKALFSDTKNKKDDVVGSVEDGLASMVMYWVLYSPSLDISSSSSTNSKNNKKITKPEFAESVDISGTGDPCSFAGVGYTVNWTYNSETDMVEFSMKHPIRMGKWWSAVGIGDTMADMDIAIMFISSGRPKRIRDYISKSYGVPEEDKQQDWILSRHRTKSIDEMIELGFSRKLETSDTEKDRTLDGCVLFQFAANAGHYGTGFAVRKHEEWPDLYKACDIKKHCIKKETTTSKESEEKDDGKEEISESNDDEIIDEADDESDEKVISLKKRTESKVVKAENRRQLESSQTENDDGTSTTNLVIQLTGATFSTLVPSESEEGTTEASAEGTTASSGEVAEAVVGQETTAASEGDVVENQMSAVTTSGDGTVEGQGTTTLTSDEVVESQTTASGVEGAELQETTLASDEGLQSDQTVAATTSGDQTVEGFQAINNVVTESPNNEVEISSTPILGVAASEVANNEVGPITTTSAPEATATATSENAETTTPGANVTQQPVHIIPMIGGELNSTMYIPGSEELRITPEGSERVGENGQGNGTFEGSDAITTSVPAFGIYSTVRERPTTISSGESDVSNSDVTGAPRLSGVDLSGNAGTDTSLTSEGFDRNESTDLLKMPSVTVPLNNNANATMLPNLGESDESETTSEGEIPTTETGLSVGKNQVETITVPSDVKESIAEAGKKLTDFAETLNNTKIEVEVTTVASDSEETTNENGSKNVGGGTGEEEITTAGEVEIVAETTAENSEVGETTPASESALKNEDNTEESTTLASEGTNIEGGEATTISIESVTEGGKKGNKGKGKGKNKNGKGKNAETLKDSTIAPSGGEIENGDVTVSSDVTTASGISNIEETTIADDSDLTQKQSNEVGVTTSEGAVTVPASNGIGTNENDVTFLPSSVSEKNFATTLGSQNPGNQGPTTATVTTIDSDANGSTVAIGMLPEINTSDGTGTTVPGLATTKSVKLVTGGDSNESGDTTENLFEILSTTVGRFGNGLRDSAVTEASSSSSGVGTNKVTSPIPNSESTTTTQATNESPRPEEFGTPEVEGSGEASPSSSSLTSEAVTTPIPGPFDHQKQQQLINELGKEAVGNPKEGCGESHEDYSQCTVYFKNYLGRVQIWANENNERMEDQYGKACTLLSQVQNVTSLCCSIFVETCKGKIEF